MPSWLVSEPYINLRLEDDPLGYQPALGPRLSFHVSYRQRGGVPEEPGMFSLGTNWSCSLRAYVVNLTSTTPGLVRLHCGSAGLIDYYDGVPQYRNGSVLNIQDGGASYQLTYADGSQELYGARFASATGLNCYFITQKTDPAGNALTFTYTTSSDYSSIRLTSVTDGDGRVTHLYYENATFTNLITKVVDPFSRTNLLRYDESGYPTNIVDVAGLATSFRYDGDARRSWITNMTTPYGNTGFRFGGVDADSGGFYTGGNQVNRFAEITLPDGGKQLFLYRHDCSGFMPVEYDTVPDTSPLSNTLDNTDQYSRNSFRWGPLQYSRLSTTDPTLLTSADYAIGHLIHWLLDTNGETSSTLSLQRDPSPDGSTVGQITWYDYDARTSGNNSIGTNAWPSFVCLVLPDGTTRFSHYSRNTHSLATREISTYSQPGGTVGLRTNSFTYSGDIDLVQWVGPNGVQVVSNYFGNTYHQPDASYDALNQPTRYTYDAYRRLSSVVRSTGLTTTNIYFASGDYTGWLEQTIDLEIGRTNTYTYLDGLVHTHTDERGLTTTNTWDALQRLRRTDFPDGTFVTNAFDKLDLVRVVDRMNFTTDYAYDSLRRRIGITNALTRATLYDYCSCGALDSIQDAAGNFTSYTYDTAGHPIKTSYADQYTVTNNYNLLGQITNIVDSAGYSVTNWFNNQGLLFAVSNAFGQAKALVFDIEDRATNSTDVNGVRVTATYDDLGRVLSRSYPDTGVEHFAYAAAGLVGYTNQLGFGTRYGYDPARRKTAETNANSEITLFSYSPAGDLLALTDGKSQTTTWVYDQYGRVTNKLDNLSTNLFRYAYDADNRLSSRWTPAKGTTTYLYDPVGNLTNITYPVSSNISFAYDPLNRLTNMVDGVGGTHYSYDAAGHVLSEDGPWDDDTVSYTYANRLRQTLTVLAPNASAWSQGYTYDAADRLAVLASRAGTFTYLYTAVVAGSSGSLVSSVALPNGMWVTNVYDTLARLSWTDLQNYPTAPPGGLDSEFYGYNTGSQRTSVLRSDLSTVDYTYDNIGQLKTAKGRAPTGQQRLQEQLGYVYDAAGNLNWRTNNALVDVFNVNSLNELTTNTHTGTLTVAGTSVGANSVTVNGTSASLYFDGTFAVAGFTVTNGNNSFTAIASDHYGRHDTNTITVNLPATVSYSYDLNGNLLSDGNRYFAYDDENQLTSVTVSNSWRSEFVYDGKMRRRIRREYTWKSTSGTWNLAQEVHYIYDGNLVIQERDGNNLPTVTYTRGTDLSGSLQDAGGIGGLLARSDNQLLVTASPGAHAYYHADGNGNITCLVNTNQAVVAKYLYDPFGNTLSESGPLADANLYRFSSKEFHANSGLVYYLYRCYDPNLQRWLNRDPLEEDGGLNLYTFVENNPLNQVDPFGYSSLPITVVEAIASGNVAQMQALLDLAGELSLSPAAQAALRAAIANAARAAALAAAAAGVCEMARHESGQRNYINDKAAEISKKSGDPICTVLQAMMDAAKQDNSKAGKALQQTIKQAMKAAGCRHHN